MKRKICVIFFCFYLFCRPRVKDIANIAWEYAQKFWTHAGRGDQFSIKLWHFHQQMFESLDIDYGHQLCIDKSHFKIGNKITWGILGCDYFYQLLLVWAIYIPQYMLIKYWTRSKMTLSKIPVTIKLKQKRCLISRTKCREMLLQHRLNPYYHQSSL